MITIDLTQTELFKSFIELGTGESYVDLHNEFFCYSINYSQKQGQLSFSFNATKSNLRKIKHVALIFKNVAIELMDFKIDETTSDVGRTIDMVYRGRFEDGSNELKEISADSKYYYYIDFLGDYSFEVFSDSVIAELR